MDLHKYFEQLDEVKIREFVQRGREENLMLEFKTVTKSDLTDKQDKRTLAKSLSGFANSSGGTIVWGVKARPNQQGIDCACGFKEIHPLSQFMSRLNQFTGELVQPIVEGVQHKGIEVSGDTGFAVTIVPESDNGPHMAMGFEGRHFKRSGDSFYPMEHFDIEDMFGRRKKPKLLLCPEVVCGGISGTAPNRRFDCHLFVGIESSGRGLAKHVAIEIELNQPYILGDLRYYTGEEYGFKLLRRFGSKGRLISLGADTVIHPKSSLRVALIPFKVMEASTPSKDLVIEAEIMAEDMRIVKEKKVVTGNEVKEKIVPSDR